MNEPAPIDLVPLRIEDHASWFKLWRAYHAFYQVDIPPEVSSKTWDRLLDAAEPMRGILAWRLERPMDWCITSGIAPRGRAAITATCRAYT